MATKKVPKDKLKYYAVLSLLTVINLICLLIGILFKKGGIVAWASLVAGIICAHFLWFKTQENTLALPKYMHLLRLIIAFSGRLSLYSNLAWLLWALSIPVSIGTVVTGNMAENYRLGPATLVYTALSYYFYQVLRRRYFH